MSGVLSSVAAGIIAALLARIVPRRRKALWKEALAAIVAAVLAGAGATALDFGGLATIDPRSAAFAFLAAAAAIAIVRLNR
ncbi:MAG TPA: hypothetical protein VLV48_05780 [Thermoanaerobaculia bacterium]|nr:hypothetical protein [Thermoanaerobaculia bacterium]